MMERELEGERKERLALTFTAEKTMCTEETQVGE